MKDSEARGLVLQRLYKFRERPGGWLQPSDFTDVPVSQESLPRIVGYLVEQHFADWKPVRSGSHMGIEHFIARITSAGVDVVEGTVEAPPTITIMDNSIKVQGSIGVQIGQGNTQTLTMDTEKLIVAVDNAQASLTEKEEAKSLLRKIAENKLVQTVITSWLRGGL
jgi:hypothetical protein